MSQNGINHKLWVDTEAADDIIYTFRKGEYSMEMTMNMRAFRQMDDCELMEVDGGGPGFVILVIMGVAFFVCGTKGCADADAGK